MAYVKQHTLKGVTAEYWTIMSFSTSKQSNSTNVNLRLYLNEDVRRNNPDDFLDAIDVTITGYALSLEDIYPMIAEAQTRLDTFEEITTPEVTDEEGNVITPAITTRTRIPFFSDAVSDE